VSRSAAGPYPAATAEDLRTRRLLAWANFEGEFVVADADVVTVGEVRAGADSPVSHLDTVGRPQIGDHETCSGVDDDGVVAADVGIV
jgi:hypothetical protein